MSNACDDANTNDANDTETKDLVPVEHVVFEERDRSQDCQQLLVLAACQMAIDEVEKNALRTMLIMQQQQIDDQRTTIATQERAINFFTAQQKRRHNKKEQRKAQLSDIIK